MSQTVMSNNVPDGNVYWGEGKYHISADSSAYRMANSYRHLFRLFDPEEGSSTSVRNVGNYLPIDKT